MRIRDDVTDRQQMSLSDIQGVLTEGLKVLTEGLERLGIDYYLAFGTLLGAVRHGGIIPWDDDIDILVPRYDYHRISELAGDINTNDWKVLSHKIDNRYVLPWAKYCHRGSLVYPSRFSSDLLYGCSIDIFPLEAFESKTLVDSKQECARILEEYRRAEAFYKPLGILTTGQFSGLKRAVKSARYGLVNRMKAPWPEVLDSYEKHRAANWANTEYVGMPYLFGDLVWKREWFAGDSEKIRLSFAGDSYLVPAEWDKVLTTYYGDYMTPPPEDERGGHSYAGVFWR